MSDLQNCTTEQLKEELQRREIEEKKSCIPVPKKNIDVKHLVEICEDYKLRIISDEEDDDDEYYLYEALLTTVYDNFFDWYDKVTRGR